VSGNYGFGIFLLHLNQDTDGRTKTTFEAFWPVMSRGIVFDEYGLTGMGESQTVDEYLTDMDVADELYFIQTPRLLP